MRACALVYAGEPHAARRALRRLRARLAVASDPPAGLRARVRAVARADDPRPVLDAWAAQTRAALGVPDLRVPRVVAASGSDREVAQGLLDQLRALRVPDVDDEPEELYDLASALLVHEVALAGTLDTLAHGGAVPAPALERPAELDDGGRVDASSAPALDAYAAGLERLHAALDTLGLVAADG